MEGAVCRATNPHDEQTPLITVRCVLFPNSALNNLFYVFKHNTFPVDPFPDILRVMKNAHFKGFWKLHGLI